MSLEAMKLALEALLGWGKGFPDNWGDLDTEAITSLRQAIEQAEQAQPVAEIQVEDMGRPFNAMRVTTHFFKEIPPVGTKLYTAPPPSQPLTDEMRKQMKERCDSMEMRGAFADGWLSAEAAHGITGEQK